MLFISPDFLLALPAGLLVYYLARRCWRGAGIVVILAASLGFICYGGLRGLLILVTSIVTNYAIAWTAIRSGRQWLWLFGVALNLIYLGYFKYYAFFLGQVLGLETGLAIALPLGISFYTFHQIAFLLDWRHGVSDRFPRFHEYVAFVSFFPQLIAGPIVRAEQFFPQLERLAVRPVEPQWIVAGFAAFIIGMSKKVILADNAGAQATPVFDAAAAGKAVGTIDAWIAALAYTFQLYFDFSGYSDMAVGLALMLGIRLPFNFYSPYQARSIAEFWRRWHITLSSFLRDYLFIPLGGSRIGETRRCLNIMIVMLLCGLWHGAGWTFIAWGALHGMYLVIHRLWRLIVGRRLATLEESSSYAAAAWVLTFLAVVIGWVLFRAQTFEAANLLLRAMAGGGGTAYVHSTDTYTLAAQIILGCAVIAFLAPSVPKAFGTSAHEERVATRVGVPLYWRPTLPRALALGALAYLIIAFLREGYSEFLYFAF